MQFIMFLMLFFVFVFNVIQLIVYYDTFKFSIMKKFFEEDKNISYRDKKYKIRK